MLTASGWVSEISPRNEIETRVGVSVMPNKISWQTFSIPRTSSALYPPPHPSSRFSPSLGTAHSHILFTNSWQNRLSKLWFKRGPDYHSKLKILLCRGWERDELYTGRGSGGKRSRQLAGHSCSFMSHQGWWGWKRGWNGKKAPFPSWGPTHRLVSWMLVEFISVWLNQGWNTCWDQSSEFLLKNIFFRKSCSKFKLC